MRPTNSISNEPIILTPAGGSSAIIAGGVANLTISEPTIYPLQLIGFVPLSACDLEECRVYNGSCYFNPVFGQLNTSNSTYENDLNTFYISDSMRRYTFWYIQKLNTVSREWEDLARVGSSLLAYAIDDDYGTYYNYGNWSAFPNYQGYRINWGHVLTKSGPGRYRIRLETPSVLDTKPQPFPYCLVSEGFDLMAWDCNRAHGTAKFESYMSGRIGSITTDGFVFDLCNISLFDSIRQKGFFGKEKTTYDEILLEYQTGKIDRVRDEAIQEFEWNSKPMPHWLHERFKAYGMMADELYVSDYNKNNSDYNIKRKPIVKSGGYEPTYYLHSRLLNVKTKFKEGIQGVIKSTSCQARQ